MSLFIKLSVYLVLLFGVFSSIQHYVNKSCNSREAFTWLLAHLSISSDSSAEGGINFGISNRKVNQAEIEVSVKYV